MSKKSLFLVIIQFSCLAYLIFTENFIVKGYLLVIQVIGVLTAVWGIGAMRIGNFNIQPEVKSNALFITKGPYKVIRNPMYFGLITFFGAMVLFDYKPITLFFYIILCIVLLIKIQMEEAFLKQRFGDVYIQYTKKSYRLIPLIF